jgi:membrane protein
MTIANLPARRPFSLGLLRPYIGNVLRNFYRHDGLNYGAALAFFFLFSLFPLLIFLAAVLAYIPATDLFPTIVQLMSLVIPASAMDRVETILAQVLEPSLGLLSSGFLGAVWLASIGADSLINSMNVVYEVPEGRPFWRRRMLAVELTVLMGGMAIVALLFGLVGPLIGSLITSALGVPSQFVALWSWVRWVIILTFLILALQILYWIAPNRGLSFAWQAPGACLAVIAWIGASLILDGFIATFARYNQVYGALGSLIVLMTWFYVSALAVLLGAELNAEIASRRTAGGFREMAAA